MTITNRKGHTMHNFILAAETGSDISPALAERYGIHLVPMHVSFGAETLDDGSFPVARICEHYEKTNELPKTSACSPADFSKVFGAIRAQWPDKHILHLAYSAATTASYQSARLAAEEFAPGTITSVDTAQVSVGQAAVVLALARHMECLPNLTLTDAIAFVEQLRGQVHMGFLPDNLEYLRAGGRVSNVAYMGGRILNLRPCIEIIDGVLTATKKYRGSLKRIVPRLIREFAKRYSFNHDCLYLIQSIGLADEVCRLAEATAIECGFREIVWLSTGCVITTHGGPGTFGLVGFSDSAAV